MMTPDQINLARRIIGLRGTNFKARGNGWVIRNKADRPALSALCDAFWAKHLKDGYYVLTARGIDQLKLQIGEFSFN